MDASARYFLVTINSVLAAAASIMNLQIILTILRTPALHTPSNVLLFSLALSDFGVGLVVQPMFVVILIKGHILRHFFEFASLFLCGASFLTMAAIAVDRYVALVLHIRYQLLVTVRRVSLATALLWFLSFLANSLRYILDVNTTNLVIVLVMCFCLVTSTYCYFQIQRIVRRHRRQIRDLTVSVPQGTVPTPRQGKTIQTMYYIHALFLTCVIPYPISLGLYLSYGSRPDTVLFICSALTILFLNSSLNPYLYCWRLKEIRQELTLLLKNVLKVRRDDRGYKLK